MKLVLNNMIALIDNGHGANTPGKCSPDKQIREYSYASLMQSFGRFRTKIKIPPALLNKSSHLLIDMDSAIRRLGDCALFADSRNI